MSSILGKKFNGLMVKPMAPFFFASLIVMYGVSSIQDSLSQSDRWKNDPRNPNFKTQKPVEK